MFAPPVALSRKLFISGAVLVLVLLAACAAPTAAPQATTAPAASASSAATSAPAATTASQPYVINALLSLTGGGAFLGTEEKQSLDVYEKYINAKGGINGTPVHFVVQDDQTDPKVGVQLATDLIAKKVPVIIGPALTGVALAVAALATNGPVIYTTTPGVKPAPNSYIYSTTPDTYSLIEALLTYFRGKGWTKIAALTSTDASGSDGLKGIQQKLALPENSSLKLVDSEQFDSSASSVSAQIAKIKDSGAQALIVWSTGTPATTAFKGITQGGLNIPVATTDGNETFAQMQQYKDFMPAELYIGSPRFVAYDVMPPGPAKTAVGDFQAAFKAINVTPDFGQTPAWDAAAIVVEALKKTGLKTDAKQLRDAIDQIKGFEGVDGTYNLSPQDHRGLTIDSVYVARWDATKQNFVAVSSAGGAPLSK
ncbi:MAG: ABC transporter substrate-binding protein [Chloroflexi bacterium]|nr:ABC transporter substrate-binding protein [Chloroflexota bacterium]